MTTKIYPYKSGSASAKSLAQELGIKRLKQQGSRWRQRLGDKVINWGCGSALPYDNILNTTEAVSRASNKRLAFEAMAEAGVEVPRFTTDVVEASEWGTDVVCRHKLTGHSGEGIEIVEAGNPLPAAPLYVEYVKKKHEYRIHVGLMPHTPYQIIDQQRKARNRDIPDEEVDWKVRNHGNGFIFMREGVDLGPVALALAGNAIEALGLNFGAVDIIYNEHLDKYYVLEVNTAPGLTGTTLENWANWFRREVL